MLDQIVCRVVGPYGATAQEPEPYRALGDQGANSCEPLLPPS